ncbi:MAG: PAS domain S-box protein [Mariprofundaceae bacterium]
MLNKLSIQIGLLFFLSISLILGIFFLVEYNEESEKLPQIAEADAVESTELIALGINRDVLYSKSFQLWKEMTRIQQRFDEDAEIIMSEFAILDGNQRVLTHSHPQQHPLMKHMDIPKPGILWSDYNIQVVQHVLHPSDGRIIGFISIIFDASSIQQELAKLKKDILLSFILALFVSIVLAIGAGFRISTPLKKLTALSARIGEGDMDISEFSFSPKEIKDLARSIQQADQAIASKTHELAESQSLLKAVLDHSPAVIFIKDIEGRYILVNARYEELYHISHEDIIGKTDADIFDAKLATELRHNDLQIIQSGEASTVEESVPDDRGIRHYYSLKFPLCDANDQVYAVCGIATDITEQKENVAEMVKLVTVIEQADELVIITDKDGIIEYVNHAFERTTGYTSHEMMGQTPRILKSGQHKDTYYHSMWETLKSGKAWHDDFINKKKDGTFYEVTQSITPIKDQHGEITGFSSVQRDVTDERKMQHKLQHTDRVESLGVLAGGIAHDFNNLLTAILGNASLALNKLELTSPITRHLESIENASHSAADLCRQMLAYSGKGKFIVKPINLSELIETMSKLIEVSLEKNVVLKYHLTDQIPAVDGDIAQMQQVILNLITNASEAIGGKSGVISLSTGMMQVDAEYLNGCISGERLEPGRYVYMEVSDTGCGMDSETQKKIFDPFFTTKFTGRGLGMSAMLGIVQGHKGGLRIYSEEKKGTTIKIAFPISLEHADHIEQQKTARSSWEGSGTVLIIDDEETVREVASVMLEDLGFKIITANDGIEGIEQFRQHQQNITHVLLDMTMPRMNGEDCFSELRALKPDVSVILSSGYNEQDATSRFAGKGLAGFIQKPYSPQQLADIFKSVTEA